MDLSDLIINNLPSPFAKPAQRDPKKVQTCTIRSRPFIAGEDIAALGGTLMVLSFQELDLQLRTFHLFTMSIIFIKCHYANYQRATALNKTCYPSEKKAWKSLKNETKFQNGFVIFFKEGSLFHLLLIAMAVFASVLTETV